MKAVLLNCNTIPLFFYLIKLIQKHLSQKNKNNNHNYSKLYALQNAFERILYLAVQSLEHAHKNLQKPNLCVHVQVIEHSNIKYIVSTW